MFVMGQRILWLNWKDIKNPDAGGAEVFTHEIGRRLVQTYGHEVTLFTSQFSSSRDSEDLDGVRILRRGGKYSVYKQAQKFFEANTNAFDLIIDEINTRPFLTPKYVKNNRPIVPLIHQFAREFWFYETPFPLNYLGYYYLENKWLSHYKNLHTLTVSNSTKKDLEKLGFRSITVIPEGLSVKPLDRLEKKEDHPTFVFVGRLKKAKLPDHALKAFSIIQKELKSAKLWVIGSGYMYKSLQKSATDGVIFHGHLSDVKKYSLIAKAHMVLVPAVREGWGLVVTESDAMGTPAIAYNVNGLRDCVIHQKTGILAKNNTPEDLANKAISLIHDKGRLEQLSLGAIEFSRQFNWDRSAKEFNDAVLRLVR